MQVAAARCWALICGLPPAVLFQRILPPHPTHSGGRARVDPDVFNEVPLLALLDAEEGEVLAQQVSKRNVSRGEALFKAGEAGKHAYLLQYGRVNVSMEDVAGDTVVVDVVDKGGLLMVHASSPR